MINSRSIQDLHIFGDPSRIPIIIVERVVNAPLRTPSGNSYFRNMDPKGINGISQEHDPYLSTIQQKGRVVLSYPFFFYPGPDCKEQMEVVEQFGMTHLFDLPIRPTLSASGDCAIPEVVADPQGEVGDIFQNLGVCVVQHCAKIRQQVSTIVMYDKSIKATKVKVPDSNEEFLLHAATVWRNDSSAQSVLLQSFNNCCILRNVDSFGKQIIPLLSRCAHNHFFVF
ncbi:hypothetical protein L2E82_43660 [Cichorium intybus]|uniref:Uncharacterized protein n=1 Tax=Cichorium intybus TaxID=13427 RepID=A0ACB8ZP08_CICIN|nr:hypothetical protein L2E82_43660 [Cichorium intybus]